MKQFTFPSHLAFGKLNYNSICKEGNYSLAEYRLLQEKILEVKVKPGYACISDYLSKEKYVETEHLTLEKAFKQHFLQHQLHAHPTFSLLCREISSLGNVYFQNLNDKQLQISYFPNLCMFLLRTPIYESHNVASAINLIKGDLLTPYFYKFYETTVLLHPEEKEIDISMLELLVPLAFLYEVVSIIKESDILSPEEWCKLIIQESTQNSGLKSQHFNSANKKGEIYTLNFDA
jgi:hypothetical protein